MSILPVTEKSCTNPDCPCENPQPLEAFSRNARAKDEKASRCKTCGRIYYLANSERIKRRTSLRYQQNKEPATEYNRNYREQNREKLNQYNRLYYAENREALCEAAQAWRKRNPGKVAEHTRLWREANPEGRKAYDLTYRLRHKPVIRERIRRWQLKNPDKMRVKWAIQGARRRGAKGRYSAQDIKWKLELQGGLCYYCGVLLTVFEVDHKIPVSKGGTNLPANICCACEFCNSSKGNLNFWDFLERTAT